jgi:5-amino-6-(5-phosphoribosylamino)uracil reductase
MPETTKARAGSLPGDLPYVVLSCAITLDGYLDDASEQRLMLSGPADLDRVDEVRAWSDAILVGAVTVRNDDPRLLVRSPARVTARRAEGRSSSPMKVTVTGHAKLARDARFFICGDDVEKVVFCGSDHVDDADAQFGDLATVVDGGREVTMRRIVSDLGARGVRRLMVEGGATVHTQFLSEGLADELHLVIAPLLLGDGRARRWLDDAVFPGGPGRRATLVEARAIEDVVLLRYTLSERCLAC